MAQLSAKSLTLPPFKSREIKMPKFYVLRNDSGNDDGSFNTLAMPFDDEKAAYNYCVAQCVQFPLSTFLLVSLEKDYKAIVTPP